MPTLNKGSAWENTLDAPYFFHPLILSSVLLLIVNDHFFKYKFPGLVTGKLSDFAGVFFVPFFLCAIFNIGKNTHSKLCKRPSKSKFNSKQYVGSLILIFIPFVLIKTVPLANEIYQQVFWLIKIPVHNVMDATDLWAVTMIFPGYLFAKKFF